MAARKFLVSLDLTQQELQNARVQNLASAPGTPVSGQIYYDTTLGRFRVRNASAWVELDPSWLLGQANTWTSTNAFNGAVTGNSTINLTGTGAHSVGGNFTAVALIASGLTGATSASRYVGATASAAPATGTFVTGDYAIGQNGSIFVCTAGGSPGTWATIGSAGSSYSTVQDDGSGVAQRAILNFVSGTYTTASAVDSGGTKTNVTIDVSVGSVTAQTSFGASSGNGSATTLSRSDHVHGTPTHDGAAHSAISHSSLAAPTADISWGGFKITSLGTPTATTDAATKAYVDSIAAGLNDFKQSVRVATTTTGTLATAYENGDTVDGVTLVTGDRILIKNQSSAAENGIYTVNVSGAPTRATDADANGEISVGTLVYVESGTTNGGQQWIATATGANPWVAGSSTSTWALYFAVTATQAGAGLVATANVLDVGAGTGIVVGASDVAVNRTGTNGAHVPLLYTTATHASSTSVGITHNLGNQWVVAQVYEVATGALVECDIVLTSTNVTTFNFNTAPSANTLRFTIYG